MRVVASHLHMRRVPVSTAPDRVLEAAQRVEEASVTPEIERLEKATGNSIAELAKHAAAWSA